MNELLNRSSSIRAFTRKPLFPPMAPSSIPAFVGDGEFRIFFKKSVANFAGIVNDQKDFDKFNQVHISVHSLETNRNSIDTNKYKTGYICIPLSKEALDSPTIQAKPDNVYRVYDRDPKTPYCIVLNGKGSSFKEVDKLYKVQLRLGNWTNQNGSIRIPKDENELRLMERDNTTTSEWSTVIMMKPISAPSFGIYKFYTDKEFLLNSPGSKPEDRFNKIGTANFEYVGFYSAIYDMIEEQGNLVTAAGNERLTEYRFKMFDGTGKKLLSDSGPINLTEHERKNISHSFSYLTQDQEKYYVDFSIKTENGYEETKRYPIKAEYVVLEMSNAMVRVTEERPYARMKLQIQAKQVVLEPILKPGTTEEMSKLGFVKDIDDPMYKFIDESEQSKIESTHAMIEGSVATSKSFYLSCPNDVWVIEAKIAGLKCFKDREEALKNPYLYLENEHLGEQNIPYLTKAKIITYEKVIPGLGVSTEIVTNPTTGVKSLKKVNNDKKVYIIEAIKTSYKRVMGKEIPIGEQTVKTESVTMSKHSYMHEFDGVSREIETNVKRAYKNVTALDFIYPMKEDGSRQKTPIEADPVIKEVTRKSFITNKPKPINPCQEYYLFLTSYMGGFGMELIEEQYGVPDPKDPTNVILENYIIKNPVLKKFLETKKIPE